MVLPICSPLFEAHAAVVRMELLKESGISFKFQVESKLQLPSFAIDLRWASSLEILSLSLKSVYIEIFAYINSLKVWMDCISFLLCFKYLFYIPVILYFLSFFNNRCCFRSGTEKVKFKTPTRLMCQDTTACIQIHNVCSEDVFVQLMRSNIFFVDFLLTLSV